MHHMRPSGTARPTPAPAQPEHETQQFNPANRRDMRLFALAERSGADQGVGLVRTTTSMGTVSELSPTGRGAVEKPSMAEPLRPVFVVVALLAVMWAAEIVDLIPGTPFDRWGIRPRTIRGLAGIPLAPFLHSGFGHLFANTIPFLVLGASSPSVTSDGSSRSP